jgi:hypothetical protein
MGRREEGGRKPEGHKLLQRGFAFSSKTEVAPTRPIESQPAHGSPNQSVKQTLIHRINTYIYIYIYIYIHIYTHMHACNTIRDMKESIHGLY